MTSKITSACSFWTSCTRRSGPQPRIHPLQVALGQLTRTAHTHGNAASPVVPHSPSVLSTTGFCQPTGTSQPHKDSSKANHRQLAVRCSLTVRASPVQPRARAVWTPRGYWQLCHFRERKPPYAMLCGISATKSMEIFLYFKRRNARLSTKTAHLFLLPSLGFQWYPYLKFPSLPIMKTDCVLTYNQYTQVQI